MILPPTQSDKLKLKYLKSGFKCKKDGEKFYCFTLVQLFQAQLKFEFRLRP